MTSAAFDAQAATYDAVAETALGRVLRDRVHAVLTTVTAPGDYVVDIGCGTGIDAAWLAPQVRSVLAIDASSDMVEIASSRCAEFAHVTVTQADASSFVFKQPVDVVLANFGAVNCVGDLSDFGDRLHDGLVAGGCAVLVTMSRFCPVELAIGAATRNRALLQRRRASTPVEATGYGPLRVRYASARDLQKAFGDKLKLQTAESLGLVLPPFEQRHWVETRPRLRGALAAADQRLARFGARAGLGDHHIAVFERAQ